jgi:alkanesulfonate monooxygenase SsuD/methylene tetrahydromethanopterin reductase-like flavin-dependent oxidoreductase (luciferase family)
MRFGLLMTNQHPLDTPLAVRFAETIAQVRLARELGFDMISFGQHFLTTEFQMVQPAIAAARLAAEAGSMRVGITIYLLPLLNPVAVAEEAASLDVVSGGRFVFGIGLGYRDIEDRAFGLGKGERVPRLLKHLEIIKQLWAGEAVTFDSPYCQLNNARLLLCPVQQPHPPIWVAANNDRAVERAAELGDAWVINPHATLQTIARQMGLYRAALARVGKPLPTELPMMREICVADTHADAVRLAQPYLEQKYSAYVQWGQHRVLPGDDDMTQAFTGLARDRFILGDPGECAAEIARCAETTGATLMLLRLHWPGMPHAVITKSLRLLAEKVRPQLA